MTQRHEPEDPALTRNLSSRKRSPEMVEISQGRWGALIGRLYWRDAVEVEPGLNELRPRRLAFLIRPLARPRLGG